MRVTNQVTRGVAKGVKAPVQGKEVRPLENEATSRDQVRLDLVALSCSHEIQAEPLVFYIHIHYPR